jgi:hypothetical protein
MTAGLNEVASPGKCPLSSKSRMLSSGTIDANVVTGWLCPALVVFNLSRFSEMCPLLCRLPEFGTHVQLQWFGMTLSGWSFRLFSNVGAD